MQSKSVRSIAAIGASLLAACQSPTAPVLTTPTPTDTTPPPIYREMRGLWIATVANIDWPSAKGLTMAQQKAELIDILDRAASNHLNTIVFHIRPACDAVYRSSLEP